jgi:hypothetical protein
MMLIERLRESFVTGSVLYTRHARREMEFEEHGVILEHEVAESIDTGEIIETYPADTPYPSALVFGVTNNARPIHIVCAYDEEDHLAIVIAVYQPDERLWIEFRKRRTP